MASHIYSPQLTSFISLSSIKAPTGQVTQHLTPYMRTMSTGFEQPYIIYPSQPSTHTPSNNSVAWPVSSSSSTVSQSTQQSEAYLTPISVNDCPPKAFAVIADSNKLRFTNAASIPKSADYSIQQVPGAYVQSATPRSSPVTIVVEGNYPQSSPTTSLPFCPSSSCSSSSSSSTASCPGSVFGPGNVVATTSCMPVPSDINYPHAIGSSVCALSSGSSPVLPPITIPNKTGQRQQAVPSRPVTDASGGISSVNGTGGGLNDSHNKLSDSSAFPADDSLYEITEEEMREIDASLTNNPDVMASRQWKYYVETNEWTRATCALMACLFTRDQMANSTVLGRGGSQRARLPSNLVAYVVGTIRKRFNKPAAAVRARMAQKCKDERRFGRLTVTGNGPIYTVDGSHEHLGGSSPVAAISVKHNGSSRRARKRPATTAGTSSRSGTNSGGTRPPKSSQSSSPLQSSSDFASTPGYQPTAYLDDACSSTTDSNQLPAIALSPTSTVPPGHSTDADEDLLYTRPMDDCLRLSSNPTLGQTQSLGGTVPPTSLSMMLMVPSNCGSSNSCSSTPNSGTGICSHLDPIQIGSSIDSSVMTVTATCHRSSSQSAELTS
ncbi:BEN domain [Fasciola gigantica]|uniref:BEN domain n=1 Tax=Fasciola gigantica TaxID=46835 RepID=A0A504Y9L1_FASGI|nr:BEN domain [Fasciola gigantica]